MSAEEIRKIMMLLESVDEDDTVIDDSGELPAAPKISTTAQQPEWATDEYNFTVKVRMFADNVASLEEGRRRKLRR